MDDQTKDYENKLNFQIDSWDLTVALEAGEEVVVIDARSPESYARGRIPNGIKLQNRAGATSAGDQRFEGDLNLSCPWSSSVFSA